MSTTIDIKSQSGQTLLSTPINTGAKGKFTLMKEDYIILPFSVPSPISFKQGDYVDLAGVLDDSLGGKLAKIYEIVDTQKPAYNSSTGGYDYNLRLDAYYWKWKNKIFKYTPEQEGGEASWSLTAPLDVQLGVFLRNLKALGYTYRGTDFTYSIDDTVENKAVAMTYDNMNLLDALFSMAGKDKWNCDCWITDNVIHFGRNEFGDAVKIERGAEASAITRSESRGTYATRIYAFGSTRNIPANYRPSDEQAVVNGVVQKRLMLPSGTPYIDAYEGMTQEEAIEDVVVFDEIYPRRIGTLSDVQTVDRAVEGEDGEQTGTFKAYQYKDTGITFDDSYILPDQELRIEFQSGKLNGLDFAVTFNPNDADPAEQLWEIVANEDYGRRLPDEVMKPENGDTYILYNFDIKLVSDQYIPAAEEELKEKAQEYVDRSKKDDGTYPTTLMSDWVHEDPISRTFEFGQRINLVDDTYFENGRISRVLGWEMNLDIPWDSPIYTIGESMPYSRIGEIEDKVDALTYKGQTYTGVGGSGVYIIRTNDSTAPSDSNVFSALRSLSMFLRKDQEDSTAYLLKLLGGTVIGGLAKFGEFVTGVSGGMIDEDGQAELDSLFLRSELIVPAIRYNYMTYFMGYNLITPGGGLTVKDFTDNGDGSWTVTPDLEEGMPIGQYVDDILLGYWYDKDSQTGDFAGFKKVQFRVTSVDYDSKTFTMTARPYSGSVPSRQMKLGQTGNFTNTARQTYMILDVRDGNNCITFYDNASTWDPEPAQVKSWLGKKKGMTVQGIGCDNYSAVLQNVLLSGLIFQIDEITGQSVRVPIDKGEWAEGTYGYYDRVSHNGALWLCVDTDGTDEEPGTGNAWLKQVDKGEKGDPGLSVVGGGHWDSSKVPYAANTLVTMYNCVFASNVETSNPPIAIMRFKDGSFIRKADGGYILAGKSADFTVNEDWTMLLDGRELKGTSITFLGSFASAPANPSEGNSYYNTTDKCTYIWQSGRWMLMVSDGKDGRDYEYIYTRNNSVGIAPEKPESPQQDDYVPEGWTDDFLGVDENNQVEWGCKRTKKDGTWSEWSDPAIVHRWSKDGENAVIADLDNEMVGCALTSDGNAVSAQSWTTNVAMWYGYEQLELTGLTASASTGLTASASKDTGVVTVSVAQGTALQETNNVTLTLTAAKNGQNFQRTLTFTVSGVRGGADAVVYSLVPSASSVSRAKDGSYSVSSVSCTRQKTVGGTISDTTDGELKYSLDGGAETAYTAAISTTLFTKSVKFLYYVGGKLVDVETIPMLSDGQDGQDGASVEVVGHWESSSVPYRKNQQVNLGGGSFVALTETSNPPLAIMKFKDGSYIRTTRGYLLAGRSQDMEVNADWQMVAWTDPSTVYRLDSPVSAFGHTSTGSFSPSSVEVTCRQIAGQEVSLCSTLYLVGRRYNGSSWSQFISPVQANKVSVSPSAGYTQYTVRAYRSSADASAWNDSYVAELGIGVAEDGLTLGFPYDCGVYQSGQSYVWNSQRRDKVIYRIGNAYYNFLVKNFGSTVTAAPTSVSGDANWEAMQKFQSIVTDTLFADGANIGGFQFKLLGYDGNGIPYGEMRSQNTNADGTPVLSMNTKTGKMVAEDIETSGIVKASQMYLKLATNTDGQTYNGAMAYRANGKLPQLSPGECMEIKVFQPQITRAMIDYHFEGENANVQIAIKGDYMNRKSSFSASGGGGYFHFIGVNNEEFGTVWSVFALDDNASAVLASMSGS